MSLISTFRRFRRMARPSPLSLSDPRAGEFISCTAVRSVMEQAGRSDLLGHVMTHGRLPRDSGLPASLIAVLATATQIAPSGHLAMAAAVQACVDEAVSKTVNLPATARAIDVYDIYLSAWELACKGITVYVEGSRQAQPKAL